MRKSMRGVTLMELMIVPYSLRSSSAFDKQCILSFGIDADHTDTRVDVFAKPYTEEESDTLYSGFGSNGKIQCLGSR